MQLDHSVDWMVWDNAESVQYTSSRHGDMQDTLPTVLRGELSSTEIAKSGGAYTGLDLTFLVPAALLAPGFVPKPGDVITDADNVAYNVLQVHGQQRDAAGFQVYKCVCRDPIIAYDLQDLITIERAAISYDASGAVVKTYPPDGGRVLAAKLAARVQDTAINTVSERLIVGPETSHVIYLSREISGLSVTEDRVKYVERGTTAVRVLDLVRSYNTGQIAELPALEAKLRP
jgi:hypothetical protein